MIYLTQSPDTFRTCSPVLKRRWCLSEHQSRQEASLSRANAFGRNKCNAPANLPGALHLMCVFPMHLPSIAELYEIRGTHEIPQQICKGGQS